MSHGATLIATLTASLSLAFVLGLLAQRCRLPPLVGYLLAGVVLGPHTPGLVADPKLSQELAELGVILMMFGVGLHFSLADLLNVRRVAIPGALGQIAAATALGVAAAWAWGWSAAAGATFGLALSVASTVVLLRSLEQRGLLGTSDGTLAVGWLIVEDLAMVFALVLLPALSGATGAAARPLAVELLLALGKIAVFIALMLAIGRRAFPRLLAYVSATGSRELFTLAVISAALGVAYGSARLFGASFALGAFFAGVVMGESALSRRAAEESLPLRDAFSVLFFVSVGMLFEPRIVLEQPGKLLAVLSIVMVGKSLAALALVLALGLSARTALTVSASLAQIGEFSFMLAASAVAAGLLPRDAQSLIVAAALISISFNQLAFKGIAPVQARLG